MLTRGRAAMARCFVYAGSRILVPLQPACARAVRFARRRCIRLLVMWFVGDAGKRVALRNSVGR
jgi:hypothetical protein